MTLLFAIWIAAGFTRWVLWLFDVEFKIHPADIFIILPLCIILGPIPMLTIMMK